MDSTRKSTLTAATSAVDEGREVRDTIQGYEVVTKYAGVDGRRGTVRVYSDLIVDGNPFGYQVEVSPWNIFKKMSIHTHFGFCPLLFSEALLVAEELFPGEVGVGKLIEVLEDQYDEKYGHFYTSSSNIEVVLLVFWRLSKLPEDRRPVLTYVNHEGNSKKSSDECGAE